MVARIGATKLATLGSTSTSATPSPTAALPTSSVIRMILPPRAATSCMLEKVLPISSSDGATTITGISSSTRAIGPCFSSPAG